MFSYLTVIIFLFEVSILSFIMNGCAYGKMIMSCFDCDENGRGCKEKEKENGGILVCVGRTKSVVM